MSLEVICLLFVKHVFLWFFPPFNTHKILRSMSHDAEKNYFYWFENTIVAIMRVVNTCTKKVCVCVNTIRYILVYTVTGGIAEATYYFRMELDHNSSI